MVSAIGEEIATDTVLTLETRKLCSATSHIPTARALAPFAFRESSSLRSSADLIAFGDRRIPASPARRARAPRLQSRLRRGDRGGPRRRQELQGHWTLRRGVAAIGYAIEDVLTWA